jgi:hypothetical protein
MELLVRAVEVRGEASFSQPPRYQEAVSYGQVEVVLLVEVVVLR